MFGIWLTSTDHVPFVVTEAGLAAIQKAKRGDYSRELRSIFVLLEIAESEGFLEAHSASAFATETSLRGWAREATHQEKTIWRLQGKL